ncbi:ABC transporter permease [Streptomyces klenkii]|uniref:ABC transporter permease n=1 Tax=Streptomyces klenkii TaxID=1420899 RepID=UPI0034419E20
MSERPLWRTTGLARAAIAYRPSSFIGSFVALLVAAIVTTTCGSLLECGLRAQAPVKRYAAAPIVATADQEIHWSVGRYSEMSARLPEHARIDAALAKRIAGAPGVAAAVPDFTFPAQAAGQVLEGSPWSATRLLPQPPSVTAPRTGEAVVNEATGLTPGQHLTLTTPQGRHTFKITAVLPGQGTPAAWFEDDQAQALAGHPGRANVIAIIPRPGNDTQRLAAQVRHITGKSILLRTGASRGQLENPDVGPASELLEAVGGTFGLIATSVAVFTIAGAVSLSVFQRRRDVALLRATGATRWQIHRTVMAEVLLVATPAALLGIFPGRWFAQWWFSELISRDFIPHYIQFTASMYPALFAIGATLGTALAAALLAARRSARIRPAEAMSEASKERRIGFIRLLLGLASLAGASALVAHVASSSQPTTDHANAIILLFLLAASLLGPLLAHLLALALSPLLRLLGSPGEMAAWNVRANSRRLASAITPIALTVAFAATLIPLIATGNHHASAQSQAAVVADRIVSTTGPGLSQQATEDIARAPGVQQATGILRTSVLVTVGSGEDRAPTDVTAQGVTGDGSALIRTLDLDVREGSLTDLRPATADRQPATVAMDTLTAQAAGARIGHPVQLRLGDGTTMTPVLVATYHRGLGTAQVTLPRQTVAGHVTTPLDSMVLVSYHPGTDQTRADSALRALAERHPGLQVSDRASFTAQQDQDAAIDAWLDHILLAILVGFAAVAALNTLIMTVLERRREFGLLRLSGATQHQVLRMACAEALLVGASGLVLGGVIAAFSLTPMLQSLYQDSTPQIPGAFGMSVVSAALLLVPLSVVYPALFLMKTPPAEATAGRE